MKQVKIFIMPFIIRITAKLYLLRFLILSMLLSLSAGAVYAAPTGGKVVEGSATIGSSGSRTDINQSSDRAVIDWQGFSIASNEHVNFAQQGKDSIALNRVTGAQISRIDGKLTANGNVFLINRNGVVFGQGAQVDVNGLLATSSDISNQDFMAGRMNFSAPSGGAGAIINEGSITVAEGGLLAFVGPTVRNSGVINARLGRVALAAGDQFTLDMYGDGLIQVAVSDDLAKLLVENSGQINADGGVVALSAAQARAAVDDVVNMSGSIQARSVAKRAGKIILSGGQGGVNVAGELDVSGDSGQGGEVDVLGRSIQLKQTARINASGASGGGEIHIGGDFQGKGARQRASLTQIDSGAEVMADAIDQGRGGRIIIWSDQQTNVQGNLSARGGVNGGDGGLIETSSAGQLNFNRRAKVEARGAGNPGTWLLDPEDITIGSGQANAISDSLNNGGNVSIQTSDQGSGEGNITVNAAINKTEGGDASLSMQAHNNIDVNAPITSTSGKLNVSLKAGRSINVNAPVSTNGGSFGTSITGVEPVEPEQSEPEEEQVAQEDGDEEQEQSSESGESETEGDNTQIADGEQSDQDSDENTVAEQANQIDEQLNQVDNAVASTSNPALVSASTQTSTPEVPVSQSSVEVAQVDSPEPAQVDSSVESPAANTAPTSPNSVGITINEDVNSGGGDIAINAGDQGTATINSTLDASNASSGEIGGNVDVLGEIVVLTENAEIDASGDSGGGDVKVGGAYQGSGETPTATTTTIAKGATIKSNAINSGNGGEVIVWADDSTNFQGQIEAKGGQLSGDGGLVEVSGKQTLRFNGTVNTSAANGKVGTLLLDPTELTITNTGTATDTANKLDFTTLNSLGANNNVTVQVTDDIVFARFDNDASVPIDVVVSLVQELGKTVAFRSTDGSIIFANPADTLETSGANLEFDAGDNLTLGSLKTKGGEVTLTAGSDISLQKIDTRVNPKGVISTDADPDFEQNEVGNDIFITTTSGDVVLNDRISTGSRNVIIRAESGDIIGQNEGIIDTIIHAEVLLPSEVDTSVPLGTAGYVELIANSIDFNEIDLDELRSIRPTEFLGPNGYGYQHVNFGALNITTTKSAGEYFEASDPSFPEETENAYIGDGPLSIQGNFKTVGRVGEGDLHCPTGSFCSTDGSVKQIRIQLEDNFIEFESVGAGGGFSIFGTGVHISADNPNGTHDLSPQVEVDLGIPGVDTIACPPCVPPIIVTKPKPPTPISAAAQIVQSIPMVMPGPTQFINTTQTIVASAAEVDRNQDRTVIASQDEGEVEISSEQEEKCSAFGVSTWLAGGARDVSSSADLGRGSGSSNNANLKVKSDCLAGDSQASL